MCKAIVNFKTFYMRKLLIAIAGIFIFFTSVAQKNLVVQGTPPDLYLNHTVVAKENYYSVGRLYNVSPKELAPYNNLQFEKGLSLGQIIKIPLNQNNFVQAEEAAGNEALVPLYHVVQAKEGLYRVSVSYNKVPLDLLKKWNKLPTDAVSNGTRLIVGYLKVDKEQSPLAKTDAVLHQIDMVVEKKEEKKLPVQPKTDPPKEVVKTPVKEKVEEPVKKQQVIENKPVENKPAETKPVETKTIATKTSNNPSANFSGGFFKKMYGDQTTNRSVITDNGPAGVFKTTSGWQDGKYYCFYNEAEPGTILKITNSTNGKSVYAKVLDAVPDIKQNSGLLIRLSNAAAEELGAGDSKFDCSISYSK